MRIKKIISQIRRDFTAIYECESCGNTHEAYGYDDHYFHNEVIPSMVCGKCQRTSPTNFESQAPKYSADQVV